MEPPHAGELAIVSVASSMPTRTAMCLQEDFSGIRQPPGVWSKEAVWVAHAKIPPAARRSANGVQ